MARTAGDSNQRHILPWVAVVLWIGVIWGHSLMQGSDSGAESKWFMDFVRTTAYGLYRSDISWVRHLIAEHPGIISMLSDTETLHFYIRKGAHFSEYLVLAVLVFNAVRLSFRQFFGGMLTLMTFWVATPCIDETIQRFVPGRAGQLRDVLIDMSGFGAGVALCLVVALPIVLVKALFGLFGGGDRA